MRNIYKTFFVILFMSFIVPTLSFGQSDKIETENAKGRFITLGIGGGAVYGVNEGRKEDRVLGYLFGGDIQFRNLIAKGLTPEISFDYYNSGTEEFTGFSEYSTDHIGISLRLRYYPFNVAVNAPFIYAGVGMLNYDVTEIPNNPDAEATYKDMTAFIPFGVGYTYYFTENFGTEIEVGYDVSFTDNLNPVYDDINDANFMAKVSLIYNIYEIIKDSDGDGLSDEDEVKLGTDPQNPDTDGDGLKDGEEVKKYKTDPLNPDTDGGGVKDGIEVLNGADPLDGNDDILSIKVGEKLILKDIVFQTGKDLISPKSERILGFALKALQTATEMEIQVIGHTDNVGNVDKNLQLSIDRAVSVRKWFLDKGIDGDRLTSTGKGDTEPIVPNDTPSNRQKNRRVEFFRSK